MFTQNMKQKLLSLAATVAVVFGMSAQNKVYIEDFSVDIENGTPTEVAICLDNVDAVAALQATVVLPEGLSFGEDAATFNYERLTGGHVANFNKANGKLNIASFGSLPMVGNSGAVCWIPVVAEIGKFTGTEEALTVSLKNIEVTSVDGDKFECERETEATVTLGAITPEFNAALVAPETEIFINPGARRKVSVNVECDFAAKGAQMIVKLPAGLTIDATSVQKGVACAEQSILSTTVRDNGDVSIVFADFFTNQALTGESGELVKFDLVADDTFAADGVVEFTCDLSSPTNHTIVAEACSITVISGAPVYEKAQAEIAALRDELESALAEIAESAADVAENFTGSEIAEAIAALEEAVNAAYEDGSLFDNYDDVMAPAAELSEAIQNMLAEAKEAQAAFEAEQAEQKKEEAFEEANSVVDDLRDELNRALEQIAEEYPDVAEDFNGEEIQAAIDGLLSDIEEAYENGTLADVYDDLVAAAKENIEAAIEELLTAAEEAQRTGVASLTVGSSEAKIYTADGVEVSAPQQGKLNIIVYGNGTVKKVISK